MVGVAACGTAAVVTGTGSPFGPAVFDAEAYDAPWCGMTLRIGAAGGGALGHMLGREAAGVNTGGFSSPNFCIT